MRKIRIYLLWGIHFFFLIFFGKSLMDTINSTMENGKDLDLFSKPIIVDTVFILFILFAIFRLYKRVHSPS